MDLYNFIEWMHKQFFKSLYQFCCYRPWYRQSMDSTNSDSLSNGENLYILFLVILESSGFKLTGFSCAYLYRIRLNFYFIFLVVVIRENSVQQLHCVVILPWFSWMNLHLVWILWLEGCYGIRWHKLLILENPLLLLLIGRCIFWFFFLFFFHEYLPRIASSWTSWTIKVMPFLLRNTYKRALWNKQWLAISTASQNPVSTQGCFDVHLTSITSKKKS